MDHRIGPGPVFVYESLILARRRQVYEGRALFVLAIFAGLVTAWYATGPTPRPASAPGGAAATLDSLAAAGEQFFYAMAGIQLAMVLLVAPAATAGAICHDRAQGVFAQLAATDLSDAEIVLGKLGSRLAPILGVLACGLPVTALAALLGGIDPKALFSLFVISVAVAVLGCSLALAISVRAAKTHEVMIAVLCVWVLWLLGPLIWQGAARFGGVAPPPDWFKKANPVVLVYAPYASPGYVAAADVAMFVAAVLLLSTALLGLTIATVRRSVLEPPQRARGRGNAIFERLRRSRWLTWLPGPSLDGNPVLWREWHRNRPSRFAWLIWAIYWISATAGVGIGIREAIVHGIDTSAGFYTLVIALHLQFLVGLMLMSALAPSSLAHERAGRTLDVLMATPLSTRSIVWGKWLGTYRVVLWLAALPALASVTVACIAPPLPARFTAVGGTGVSLEPLNPLDRIAAPCLVVGQMISYGAAITSVGLALATWLPRLGHAISVNVGIFALITFGWPLFFQVIIWNPLQAWLASNWDLMGSDPRWLPTGMLVVSPFAAPGLTLDWLLEHPWSGRWKFWLLALGWCALAWAIAAGIFWATLQSFDRCLGRMPESSDSEWNLFHE